MSKSNISKCILLSTVVLLIISFNIHAQSSSKNYKMFTDVLDEFGGRAQSANYLLRIGSGGQPSVVGLSKEDSIFWAYQGYVYTASFLHGDDNADGSISVSDVVYEINYLFKGGPPPRPFESGYCNCDVEKTVSDVVCLINYLFKGGPPPCNL